MRKLDTPGARNDLLRAIDRGQAYHPVVLDHEDIPWTLFTNEDGDVYAHTIPYLVTDIGSLEWSALVAREAEYRPMRLVYDGYGYSSPGVDS